MPRLRLNPKQAKAGVGPLAVTSCAICFDDFEFTDDVRLLPGCHHVFHSKCCDQWLYRRQMCPMCRHAVKM